MKNKRNLLALLPLTLSLYACEGVRSGENEIPLNPEDERKQDFGQLFGKDFLVYGTNRKKGGGSGATVAVNPYLWRASLQSISFVPLLSVDAAGGVIVTDWYSPPRNNQERLKIVTYITGTELRSDALTVKVFKQTRSASGGWTAARPHEKTARKLEDIILSKARELRINKAIH